MLTLNKYLNYKISDHFVGRAVARSTEKIGERGEVGQVK
jgi:hypothetical protein